jgi:probable HAF family extracellular repeat protein
MLDLGILPLLGALYSEARGVSHDGSVVVGLGDSSDGVRGFRWTRDGGMVSLGVLPGNAYSAAYAVSGDGSVVAGDALAGAHYVAFRWTAAEGMVDLGAFQWGENYEGRGRAISRDGLTVAGYSGEYVGVHAFRWRSELGLVDLGTFPSDEDRSLATGVSADGSVIVGYSTTLQGVRAFRWTAATGLENLGTIGPGDSAAEAVSGDGRIVVGTAFNAACLWSPSRGLLDLNAYLPTLGIDLTGWTLQYAMGVSDDGGTILGWGSHNGVTEAWVATVPRECYANCDASTVPPVLNVADFVCFMDAFAAGDPRANCDESTAPPVLNVADFVCFQAAFAAGCP